MDDLALQVRLVDDVVVHDPQRADPGRGQVEGRRRPEPAGSDQEHSRVQELLLALLAHLRDQEMTAVPPALLIAERTRQVERKAVSLPVGEPAR